MARSRVLISAVIGHNTINIPEIISSVHDVPGPSLKVITEKAYMSHAQSEYVFGAASSSVETCLFFS